MREIILLKGEIVIVDDSDFKFLRQFQWRKSQRYAVANINGEKSVRMHRLLMSPPQHAEVDHINGDGLDNRRSNLRVCAHRENIRNSRKRCNTLSKYKGVRLSGSGNYRACIEQNGERLELGTFASERQAAIQYDRAARIFFGSFALTNEKLGLL